MEEKKLTDEEIIKALDICYSASCCPADCPYFNKHGRNLCVEDKALYKDMKRIVQEHAEQKAEIERLKCNTYLTSWKNKFFNELKAREKLQKQVDELLEERENMQAEIMRFEDMKFTQEHCDLYAENEFLKKCLQQANSQFFKDCGIK